jgi:NitT/TauT family transport system substrate-binding protein
MPRRAPRWLLPLIAAAAGIASPLVSSCGTTTPPAAPAHLTRITVGALPILDDLPVYLAQQQGYFARQGLDVSIKTVEQSTDALPDLLHGSVDIITGANYVSFFTADAKGLIDLRILTDGADCVENTHDVLALPGSGITAPADLAGKTIAVNILNNTQTMMTDETLQASGVKTMPHYVVIPFPQMPSALAAHRVQAIYEIEPYLSEAEATYGAEKIIDTCAGDGNTDLPLAGSVTTSQWVHTHPGIGRAFQRAMAEAATLADTNRPVVERAVVKYFHVSPSIASLVKLDEFPAAPNAGQIQRMVQHMQNAQPVPLLTKPLNVASIIFR